MTAESSAQLSRGARRPDARLTDHTADADLAAVTPMDMLTVISPMKNEQGNVERLVREVGAACTPLGAFELILIDDGSTDATAEVIAGLQAELPWLRLLRHGSSAGQSAAVHSGVMHARGGICATLDGDGQNPPDQIPVLVAAFRAPGAPDNLGLVAGQRVGRRDTVSKRMASRGANALRARLLRDDTRDTGCGLKAFRRDAFLSLPFFNHMHRYLPALFKRDGWAVAHVDVTHRERGAGVSNYTNIQRAMAGIYDLVGVAWLIRRRKIATPVEGARASFGPGARFGPNTDADAPGGAVQIDITQGPGGAAATKDDPLA